MKLQCRLTATPKPTIDWTKNGRPVNETRRVRIEFDGELSCLIISEAKGGDSGQYQCSAKNKIGSTSCRANLTVNEQTTKPSFREEMKDVEAVEGDEVVFEVCVSAQPEPEVEWYLRKMNIKSRGKYTVTEEPERLRYSLTIRDSQREDCGQYRCVVKNSAGEVSCVAELKVKEKLFVPTFVQGVEEQLFEVWEGAPVKLVVEAKGKPPPQVEWFKESRLARRVKRVELQTEGNKSILLIPKAVPDDSGSYRAEATNAAGTAVKSFTVKVNGE